MQSETGVDVSINSSGVYTVSSMSADTGSATFRATYNDVNIDRVTLHPERRDILTHVATVEIVWSTLYLTAGCAPAWWEKSWRDLAHYDALVEIRRLVTEEHWQIARHYRGRMFRHIVNSLSNAAAGALR